MKKIIAFIALVGLFSAAQNVEASIYGRTIYGKASVIVQEEDGSPSRRIVRLRVPNGTMTDEGGGVILIEYATPADIAAIAIDTTTLGVISDALGVSTEALRVQLLVVAGDLSTHEADTSPHSATSANVVLRLVLRDGSGDFSAGTITASLTGNADTATALAADGTDAPSGFLCLGVNAAGDCELAVIDVAAINGSTSPVQSNALFDHDALTGSSAHGAVSANTASQIVTRDGSGNFSAAIITAALSGNASTASSLAANGANCSANEFNKGVDASGVAESCATLLDADIPDTITIDLAAAATALNADPTDCPANEFATMIAASGNLTCAAVSTSFIADGSVTTPKLATDAVTTVKLLNGSVTTPKIGNDAVTTVKLADASVTTPKLGTFFTDHTADASVHHAPTVSADIDHDLITGVSTSDHHIQTVDTFVTNLDSHDHDGGDGAQIASGGLVDNAVTTPKLANDAVTSVKLADNAITTSKLATDSVSEVKVLNGAITENKLSAASVTSSKLATDAVTTLAILNDAVTAAKVEFNYAGSSSEGGVATTATALAANGANCSPNQYPLGVDTSGAVEFCTADANTNADTICTGAESLRGDGSCTVPAVGAGLRTEFVTFTGTGIVAVRDKSSGVSTISDVATGRYTVNFGTAWSNENYSCICSSHKEGDTSTCRMDSNLSLINAKTTTSWSLQTINSVFSATDAPSISVNCIGTN